MTGHAMGMPPSPDSTEQGGAAIGDFDPTAADFRANPHPTFARLRREAPVARCERWGGFFALTRYKDIVRASTDPATFSSAEGVVIPKNPVSGRRPPLHYDPPEHTVYRQALNAAFTKRRAAALEPAVRTIASQLLEPVLEAGRADMVGAFSSPLATLAFLAMLNVSPEQGQALQEHSERFEAAQIAEDAVTAEAENQLLIRYCRRFVEERLAEGADPRHDVVAALARARPGGRPVDVETITGSVRQMIIAAHIAPTCALASALVHLCTDLDLQAQLRAEPVRIADALEELLRLYTPNEGFARTVRRPVSVSGVDLQPGDQVAIVLTSANRDEAVFEHPDDLVLGRRQHHLAFGHGPHSCIGQHLARLELRVALQELLARTRSFRLDGEPTWMSWPVYGPRALPMRVVPR
jgi:cytochrome P450